MKPLMYTAIFFTPFFWLSCGNFLEKNHENASQIISEEIVPKKPQNNNEANNAPESQENNTETPTNNEKINPFTMPYYCNPLRYPPNIVNNITACKPYVGLSTGYYAGGAINYRMRWDLVNQGTRFRDDHRRYGSWRNHRGRYNNSGQYYTGAKRFGRP